MTRAFFIIIRLALSGIMTDKAFIIKDQSPIFVYIKNKKWLILE